MQPTNSKLPNQPEPSDEDKIRHDKYLDEVGGSQVDKVHGGELFEALSPEDFVTVNDPTGHEHVYELDPTETIGIAYICTVAGCGIVQILPNKEN